MRAIRPFPARPEATPRPTPRPGGAPDIAGNAEVIDGDTLRIGDRKIRIHGIDAPERAQACCDGSGVGYACGDRATEYMEGLVGGHLVGCVQTDTDKYGRMVAVCEAASLDLGYEMVRAGWALAFVRFSDDYVAVERQAAAAKRGMWAGTFVTPSEWRAGYRSCSLPELTPGPTATARPTPTLRPTPSPSPSPRPTMRPTPRPTPRPTVRPTPRPTSRSCCRVCRTGKACGDSCISRSNTCRQPPGCACNG